VTVAAAGDHLIHLSCAKFERLNCSNKGVRVSLLNLEAMFLSFLSVSFSLLGNSNRVNEKQIFHPSLFTIAIGDEGL
jgi:hypothetical protein